MCHKLLNDHLRFENIKEESCRHVVSPILGSCSEHEERAKACIISVFTQQIQSSRTANIPNMRIGSRSGAPYFLIKMFVGRPKNTTGTYQIDRRVLYWYQLFREVLSEVSMKQKGGPDSLVCSGRPRDLKA